MKLMRGVLFGALILMFGCSLEPPGAPVWIIEATVPFSKREYKMAELITDSSKLAERGWGVTVNPIDSVLRFEYRDSLTYQIIGERITYDASSIGSYANTIGIIHIEEPTPDADTVSISEANPLLQAGFVGPVLPFELSQAQDTMNFDIFHWVAVDSGYLLLTVSNSYPFPVNNLIIGVENVEGSTDLGTATFDPIAPGETQTRSIDLSGHLVYNQLRMTANGNSPGSLDPVSITGLEALKISIGVSSTNVDSAEAEIAEQTFSNPDNLNIDSKNKILHADIKRGNAFFRLTNTTRMRLTTDMVFENFFDSTGAPIRKRLVMDPMSNGAVTQLSLVGAVVEMDIFNQGIRVSNEVVIEDSRTTRYQGDSYQLIKGNQGVNVEYWTDELTLSQFEGIPDSITVDIPEMDTDVEFPQGLDAISFTTDTLFLSVVNETHLPMRLRLSIVGSNSANLKRYEIPINADLLPGRNDIVIPNADSLTSIIPDRIQVIGWAGIGKKFFPLQGVGEVSENEGFAGELLLRTGLRYFLQGDTIMTEPDSLESALDYPLQGASLTINITNQIPLGGKVELLMGSDTLNMIAVIGVEIPRGELVGKRVPVPIQLTRTEELNDEELEMMKHLPLYTRQRMILTDNLGNEAWIYGNDAISVQASATIHYYVNPNK